MSPLFFPSPSQLLVVFIFVAGTYHEDLLSFGYVVLSVYLLLRKDIVRGDPDKDGNNLAKSRANWKILHAYNLFVLLGELWL